MRKVVLISGHICTGKSGLARRLAAEFDHEVLRTSDVLKRIAVERGSPTDRISLQSLGDSLDESTGFAWLADEVRQTIGSTSKALVVDNVRNSRQLSELRRITGAEIVHVHLYAAPHEELLARYERKTGARNEQTNFVDADLIKDEGDIHAFKSDADVRINTARTDGRDTLVRVAARLGLLSVPDVRCVDVIVGGQYGSEGKGNVAAYLAKDYDYLVRVGGPNAGHTVISQSGHYTYIHLPSGSRDTDARLLLGPGMTINVDILLSEIKDCSISADRLFVDPQAMIIEPEDIEAEKTIVRSISSTGQGSGAATARRILQREPGKVRLARDIPELRDYVGVQPHYRGSTAARLEEAYRLGRSILLEGTQGSGLSIFHGQYPYVTSRDTNVAGCLAEAGISPARVRRILMVVRAMPIRVGNPPDNQDGTSGSLKHEIGFEEIAKWAKLDASELLQHEKGSRSGKPRRVGWFEWDLFRRACELNAPTDIVLTFADYIEGRNRNARRFEQLGQDTIKFIEEIERVAQAPVSLINTRFPRGEGARFDVRTVIDRRNWTTARRVADV